MFLTGVLTVRLARSVACAGLLLLSACDNKHLQRLALPEAPVTVCERVTAALLAITLPEKINVSEQEIRGERIVVHLEFESATKERTQSICVYGFDRYNEEGQQQLYRKVPTRMAVNGEQISEATLLAILNKIGFEQ